MPETKEPTSMFDTVKEHGDRIIALEEADKRHEERLRVVESNYTNLENTILKGNQQQQEFFRDTLKNQWDLIKERDKSKDAERERQHELAISNQGYRHTNMEKKWEWMGKIGVAGGVLYLVIERFFPI